VLTNLDMLYAVHSTLMICLTPEEWHSLSQGSRVQRRPQYDSLYVSHLFISACLLGIRPLACGLPPSLTLTFSSRSPPSNSSPQQQHTITFTSMPDSALPHHTRLLGTRNRSRFWLR
jgi:hypothetical protein